MIQTGQGADFPGEIGDRLGRGFVARQHFHRHDAAGFAVLRLEDLAHAALAERIDDPILIQIELRAAVEQLLGLPGVQHVHFHQPLGELLVARRCAGIGFVPLRPAHGRPSLVELLFIQQPAGQCAFFENGSFAGRHWWVGWWVGGLVDGQH